ncbi:inflorescence meristem receptor-like kinase 2 [Perilla frutescens var. hirtella]|nr:inflorescence meristem receptor-like kinase 2 [Perilla frutescens var. frutescens]KAH6787032.1 inflorescence meristem receptor-like kinase 2 [Perilla frutescens var. hirtella]
MDDRFLHNEPWKQSHLLFLLLLLINSGLVLTKQSSGAIAAEADYEALKAVKLEFVDFRGVLSSWNTTRDAVCSSWAGIKCLNGRVIAIQLPWKGLGGRISDRIGLLRSLRRLSLHDNALTGPIPASLGLLPELRGVYLFNNRLSGSIPPTFGNSLNLQILDLSNNELTGIIPPNLANSSRLFRLNLSFNKISGLVPSSLFQSQSLTFLALHHNNISGRIPTSLSNLSILEVLNLSHNQIVGKIPEELGNSISKLSFLDLSNNGISGDFPENLSNLSSLQTLNLNSNNLDGLIPESVGKLGNLSVLDLSHNNFKGQIPISLVSIQNLSTFDVSYNDLSGAVPSVLATKFNSSSFVGNAELCGYSSSVICPSPQPENLPSPSQGEIKHHGRKFSTRDIILIAAGGVLAVSLILCCVLCFCLIGRNAVLEAKNGKSRGMVSGEVESGGEVGGKLVHFDGPLVFAADDLLCATAEIIGKSSYGTAYKATLQDCNQVAVKRLKEKITKARKEFEIEVALLGRIRHPNISPLRAYYIGPKGEKLLVYDYMPNGSLASFLHARGLETSLPWPTRMVIAFGVTRGLSYLHTEENIIHGNLTSSNVLLDEQSNPKIADVGLSRLMTSAANTDAISTSGSMGYRAPELVKLKDGSTKSDVFSLGVIMLELLTGRSPSEVSDGLDLPRWVASIVKEEWTNEVFDVELMKDAPDIGEELLNMLKLALHCVDPSPEARPEAHQVLQKLEEIKLDSIDNTMPKGSVDEAAALPAKSE